MATATIITILTITSLAVGILYYVVTGVWKAIRRIREIKKEKREGRW